MTIDPFDDLERQLRGRVATIRAPRRRWWRSHRLAVVAALAGLGVSGVAFASGGLRGPNDEERGRSIATAVLQESRRDAACVLPKFVKDGPLTLVDASPPAALLTAMPWMREPAAPDEVERAVKLMNRYRLASRTQVVRSTIRLIRLDRRWEVLVRLDRGNGGFEVRDPAACQTLRQRALDRRLQSEGPGVQDWARRRLAMDTTANPAVSTLWFTSISHGRPSSGAGTSLLPGPGSGPQYEVPQGLLGSTSVRPVRSSRGRGPGRGTTTHSGLAAPGEPGVSAYTGLAAPSTTHLRVWVKRPDERRGIPKAVPVHRGFWRVELPGGTGPVRLTEIGPDGDEGRVVSLRGRARPAAKHTKR